MRVRRLPIIVLLVGVLVGGVVLERSRSQHGDTDLRLEAAMPTARPASAVGSTWYCAAGSATGDTSGFAEQTVTIANASDSELTGRLSAYSDKGETRSAPVRVGPHSRQNIRVSDVLKGVWASALVELSGGEVTVGQVFQGPAGRAVAACASSPAPDWYFPSGSTRNGTRNLLALFNPFPGDATVDLTFDTEDGARTPQQFQGLVLRGGRVTVVDVGAVVTLRDHVATSIHARTGRIVAQQLQSADGREGGQEGLAVTLGATIATEVWSFAVATPADSDAHEVIAVINPGEVDAAVEVQVQIDDAGRVGSVEPYRLMVPAGRSATVDLMADARIPRSAGRWIIVRSVEGAPVVAERTIGARRTVDGGGLTHTMGVPIGATRWLATFGDPAWASGSTLAVANPSSGVEAHVTVTVHGAGDAKDLGGLIDVVVAPGERRVVDLSAALGNRTEASLAIASDVPVVAGQLIVSSSPVEILTPVVCPISGTISAFDTVVDPQVSLLATDELADVDAQSATSATSATSSTSTTMG
ncbi:MAG: hypothetical protein EBX39_06105 [Actinobacteria bacterium]|nr:hypothetical protein [Actinomycetota bacterium]